jgi:hypothetical protein
MISFNFTIRNSWCARFDNLWCRSYTTPFTNKFIELEVTRESVLVSFSFSWTVRQDHAGLDFEAGLFGYCVHFNFYDNRHWNYEKKAWETYEENLL